MLRTDRENYSKDEVIQYTREEDVKFVRILGEGSFKLRGKRSLSKPFICNYSHSTVKSYYLSRIVVFVIKEHSFFHVFQLFHEDL